MRRRFLFFMERELHIPVLAGVMGEIHRRGLGEIGVASVGYQPSHPNMPGRGVRIEVLKAQVAFPVTFVEDPYQFAPDITFVADFSYQFVEGLGRIVNIGHGTICKGWYFSGKNISLRENCADLICVPGEIHRQALDQQVRVPVVVTGMPKLDPVFRGDWNREVVLREMGLDPANKTVLFAPTFNPELSMAPYVGPHLNKIVPDYLNLIVKLHGAAPEEWKQAYRESAARSRNIFYTEEADIGRCFVAADLLLTDVSSVIYEFIAQNKPVVLFDSPAMKDYANFDENDLEHRFRDVGVRVSDVSKVQEAIFRSLIAPPDPGKTADIARQFIAVRDGSSAAKVVDAALALLDAPRYRAALIAGNCPPALVQQYLDLYANHFELYIAMPENTSMEPGMPKDGYTLLDPGLTMAQRLAEVAQKTNLPMIVHLDAAWQCSPNLPDFLLGHLLDHAENGLAFPLEENTGDVAIQQLRFYIRLADEVPENLVGVQLTYSMPGMNREVIFVESDNFAIKTALLTEAPPFTAPRNDRLSRFEVFGALAKAGMKAVIALDTYVSRRIAPGPVVETAVPKATKREIGAERPDKIVDSPSQKASPITGIKKTESHRKPVRNGLEKEVAHLRDAIALDPANQELIRQLIRVSFEMGDYETVDLYEEMIAFDPESTLLSAIALSKQKLPERALEKIERINTLAIHDQDLLVRILNEKARLYILSARTEEAFQLAQEATALNPQSVDALITQGTYYLTKNNPAMAESLFVRAHSIDPDHANGLCGLALVRFSQNRHTEARDLYLRVLTADPAHLTALEGLVRYAWKSGDFTLAATQAENYLRIAGDSDDIQFVLAGLYFEMKRFRDARTLIDQLIIKGSPVKGLQELREKIVNSL